MDIKIILWFFEFLLAFSAIPVQGGPSDDFTVLSVPPPPPPSSSSPSKTSVDKIEETKFVVITEDAIPDIENSTQKVIRVNPLDLPPIAAKKEEDAKDSELFNIQSLLKTNRNYVNSKTMRRRRPHKLNDEQQEQQVQRVQQTPGGAQEKRKRHLHFLYNQEALDGRVVGRVMRVHIAPGAYPVYYAVAKTNGHFNKDPIKRFRNYEDLQKYALKRKLQSVDEIEQSKD